MAIVVEPFDDGTALERQSLGRAPVYDADQIAAQMVDLSARDAAWARWFDIEGVAPMQISYDALACDPSTVLADVLGALEQDPAIAVAIRPPVAKLADATNRAWAARFLAERGPDTAAARPSSAP
jgi:LPS sulfotransferase NodH